MSYLKQMWKWSMDIVELTSFHSFLVSVVNLWVLAFLLPTTVDAILISYNVTSSHFILIHSDYIVFNQEDQYYATTCHFGLVDAILSATLAGMCGLIIVSAELVNGSFCLVR
ncbi:hypothetical protein QAD02_011920 [Eretmocerus hayati]|uniref:Uncharacterized protein n=1 Tax=Eretmocerus hayati TaxID=131215 RepID=A0ACC2NXX0_9HYME|nr:hypothetical protein QAD02_011920 [Eretmocerus hayati]